MRPSPLARYLLAAYTLLIVYASLHPFTGWHDSGVAPLAFLVAPPPRYITMFDVVANLVGYAPFGFLAVLALFPALRGTGALIVAGLAALALSLALEVLQNYLPTRIASNIDLTANAVGGLLGAIAGVMFSGRLLRDKGIHALRNRLFRPGGRVDLGLVLIGLWLVSQFNPGTLLFGAGDLRELLHSAIGALHTPEEFIRFEAGVAGTNTLAVGLLAAALVERNQPVRLVVIALLASAFVVRTFAFGMLFSPQDILVWITPGAVLGVAAGTLVCIAAAALPRAGRLALSALALMAGTVLVNLAPENPYLAASLAVWRQGQLLNFNGLTRIVSVLWPFCALLYLMLLSGERDRDRQ
jgi:VanZ family protein